MKRGKKKDLKYDILVPIYVKSFEEFSEQETKIYFDWYISKIQGRIEYISNFSGIPLDY